MLILQFNSSQILKKKCTALPINNLSGLVSVKKSDILFDNGSKKLFSEASGTSFPNSGQLGDIQECE